MTVLDLTLPSGQRLVADRSGDGGAPLVALHGFPCTRRIWGRVLPGMAERGYDAVAPDLRGFGDSDLPGDDRYDLAAHAADVVGLMDHLGWSAATLVAHDLGAAVALELARRHGSRVEALVLMNHVVPGGGPSPWTAQERAEIFAYAAAQGERADELLGRLPTPADRTAYVAEFYTRRGWCPPGAFSPDDLEHLCGPFAPAERLRASFRDYEVLAGRHPAPVAGPATPVPHRVVVVLGTHDVTLVPDAEARCRAAYAGLQAVHHVADAGHFLQWERPGALLDALPRGAARVFGRPL